MFANGNSFGSDGEGSERALLSSRWMFPGGSGSGIQQVGCAR